MKLRQRIISLILILTIVLPITTQLAFAESSEEYAVPTVSYILEAENTSLNPNRSIKDDSIASNNQYLHIKENNSKVSFTVPSDLESGTYTITVTAKHPYGYKENYVNLNGERIGTIVGDSSQWQDYSFANQTISANDVIEIELYWGWFDVDSIKLIKTGTASEIINTYRIEADRMELNDSYDIIDSSSASGGKCVRAYQYTDFKFTVPQNFESGRYDITVVARHPYGYKKNYLCVNEKQVGIIEGESYNWTEYIFESQTVNPNDVIELQMEWGWFDVDYIKITPAKTEHTYSFEAEQATLSNDYLLADDETASNGVYLKIKQDTFVEFTMPSDFVSGTYNVTLKSRYPNGYKKNYMNLNGSNIATLESSEANWVDQTVWNVNLKAGDVISLSMEWGYFDIDTLTVSNEYYGVELNTENLEYFEAINAYFTESGITAISGTLNRNDVQSMKYRLTDKDGNKISSGSVDVSSNWSVPVDLDWGYNTFTTTIVCNDNKVYQKRFEIFNGNIDDADQNDDDNDGLLNYLEDYFGTDKNNADCDDDGLTDYEEIFIFGTSPLNADSDDNGVTDGNEDFDGDGLSNIYELRTYNTDPTLTDTDGDGLTDYEEIFTYFTDPNKYDTDEDGLSDGEEVRLGLNPNLGDSNNDGIPDGEEKIYQTFTPELEFREESPVTGFTVAFAGTGDIAERTTVTDMLDVDVLSSSVVGLIGSPYEITTSSTFDEATITFTIDQTKLGETAFADLGILWYDEENDQYVIIDSTLNEETSTISANVPHFSTYLVVNLTQWHEIMSDYYFTLNQPKRYEIFYDEVSWGRARFECFMKGGHLATITSYGEEQEVEKLTKNKYTSFWIGATYLYPSYLTRDNTYWAWENNEVFSYTNWGETGFYTSLMMDDYTGYYASEAHGYIYEDKWYKMIDLGDPTGGTIYRTFGYICEWDNPVDDFADADGDGIPDHLETNGMIVQTGETIYSDPNNPDCDGDGLKDGEEVLLNSNVDGTYSFKKKTDPNSSKNIISDTKFEIIDDFSYVPEIYSINVAKQTETIDLINLAKERFSEEYNNFDKMCDKIAKIENSTYLLIMGAYMLNDFSKPRFMPDKAGALYFAIQLLQHYLDGYGEKISFDATEYVENIQTYKTYYQFNSAQLKRACEKSLSKNQSLIIASVANSDFKASPSGPYDIVDTILLSDEAYDKDFEAFLALNECSAAIVCQCSFDGVSYKAQIKYYVIDYYNFYEKDPENGKKKIGLCTNDEMALMQYFGTAFAFDVVGLYEDEITWVK